MNVDSDEIKKFAMLSKDWWDPDGPMKPLHQLNPLRLQYIKDHTKLNEKKVLDVGCGGGLLAESMARECAEVTGIDLSEEVLQVAKEHAHKQRLLIDYQCISLEEIALTKKGYYDVITCMEMLEHVPNPAQILQSCAQCLKPGGLFFVSTINRNLKSFLAAIVAAEYLLNLLPRGTHHYEKLIRPSELTAWARQAGLRLGHLQGISYNPLSGIFLLKDSPTVNYMAYYEK